MLNPLALRRDSSLRRNILHSGGEEMNSYYDILEQIDGLLTKSGWTYDEDLGNDDFSAYRKTINYALCKSHYNIDVVIQISDDERGLEFCGELGVADVYVEGFHDGACPPYNAFELRCFLKAIAVTERQLLDANVPFLSNYLFERDEKENAQHNQKIRESLDLEQIERKACATLLEAL